MNEESHTIYEFGPFRLDARKRLLWRDGEIVMIKPKAFDTLLALVEGNGRVVEKEELINRVWPDTVVEEGNLAFNISSLRKALGDNPRLHQYIVTIPGEGYQFVAGVQARFDEVEVRERTRVTVESGTEEETAPESFALTEPNGAVPFPAGEIAHRTAQTAPALVGRSIERPFRHYRVAVILGAFVLVAALIAVLVLRSRWQGDGHSGGERLAPFAQMQIKRVTTNGRAKDAAISPDGRYIAYVILSDDGKQSIHLMQVDTNNSVQIRPPADVAYGFLVFAPDGKSLYYYISEEGKPTSLYRSDVLGGIAQKVLTGLNGPVTFSPDGSRIAFTRNDPRQAETALFVADADDGGQERRLAVRKYPGIFTSAPGWSPDGELIVLGGTSDSNRARMKLFSVSVADGTVAPLFNYEWSKVARVTWLRDGSGLAFIVTRQGDSSNGQLWYVSYPRGEVRRITNDLDDYNDVTLSLSSDLRLLVAVQSQRTSSIWLLPEGDPSRARQIISGAAVSYDGLYGLTWTPDGKIVNSSRAPEGQAIWIMDADGANARQLTPTGQLVSSPAVTADGRYILFSSYHSGVSEIWRMEADGSNPVQLTFDGPNYNPSPLPNGKWVVYESVRGQVWSLWKVPMDGGEPVRLTDKPSRKPSVSPDGKLIASTYEGSIALVPAAGGKPIRTFSIPGHATTVSQVVRWTPDGQALMFRDANQGLWRQPIAGGAPLHLTNFGPEMIFNLAWSPDGKQLALARGTQSYDVVLIRDLRITDAGSSK